MSVESGTIGRAWICPVCGKAPYHAMDQWTVDYNATRRVWMVWSDTSPPIAFCYVKADAERLAGLLNEENVGNEP